MNLLRTISLVVLLAHSILAQEEKDSPSLQDSITSPIVSSSGRSILLTCVVRRLGNNTLLWKYGTDTVLTAGAVRITSDSRFNVLHDEGGDVYVLQVDNVSPNDTGLYTCEVNTKPPLRSFHRVTILTDQLTPPFPEDNLNSTAVETLWGFTTPKPITHNYTDCCLEAKVPDFCLGFCSIKNILEGTTGVHPSKCDPFFKDIVQCMADGRDHVPCCARNQVPDICQDMCSGEYTVQTDDVRTHLACGSFTAPTLACIAEGIDTLPSRPSAVDAENVTDTAFSLRWSLDQNSVNPIEFFNVYVTLVGDLQHPDENKDSLGASYGEDYDTKRYKVEGNRRSFTIDELRPFSLYNVTMESVNAMGKSLPTYTLRILTLSETEAARRAKTPAVLPEPPEVPKLPDTKQCCRKNNITHASCVDNFCNPLALHAVSVPDVIVCAPWGGKMFDCARDGKDHTACCEKRDVPEVCMGICSGQELSALDYRHFRCVEFMPEIANCMLSGYDVLPGEPRDFKFSNVGTSIGILHWDPPVEHESTVDGYKVTYTLIKPGARQNNVKVTKTTLKSPYIMEDLEPDSSYEVFVQARNFYGLGDPTARIVFRTAKATKKDLEVSSSSSQITYSQPDCCLKSGVKQECLPLCQYNASLSEIRRLSNLCNEDLVKVTKCAAAGRDHLPCCFKRGVSTECQMLCQGVQYTPDHSVFTKCLSFVGNIMMCLEEGVNDLPAPVLNLHATFVEDDRITLVWDPVENSDQYEVYYKQLENNSSPASAFEHESFINVTTTSVIITGLETNQWYQFFAISRNDFGTSLPSSMVIVNISRSAWDGQLVMGRPSAPHGIEVVTIGSDTLSFTWTAPVISDHEDLLKYRFTYGLAKNFVDFSEHESEENETQIITVETYNTNLKLEGLTPNTQYVGFIQTISNKSGMDSPPSETFLAWTDPIVPAFAETPAIHPNEGLMEGDAITILCIALGSPTPTVTLYLGQHPIRSEQTRHMVTTIHNITRDMQTISCYVDNGYGTPMQSSRTIQIEREPRIVDKKNLETRVALGYIGGKVKIECEVDAFPPPSISMGKIDSNFQPSRFNMTTVTTGEGVFKSTLTILNATTEDSGDYFCRATNTHGSDKLEKIRVAVSNPTHQGKDLMQCCRDQKVKSNCLGICSLNIDLDYLLYDTECIPEFDKFMECGSDGSDHRHCCSINGVPRECLDWCRGLPAKGNSETCALIHARTISQCFHEGQMALPGPPTNIKVTPTSATSAVAFWDPPNKNPDMVELYRILWRQEGSVRAHKVDTSRTKITIDHLTPGVPYELVIKAGNANGTSQLTPPLKFITADEYIVESPRSYNQTPSIVGALLAVFMLISLILLAVWYFRGKKYPSRNNSSSSTPSVSRSFENPYFNQEVTMSTLQANDVSGTTMADAIQASSSNGTMEADNNGEIQMEAMEAERGAKWPKLPARFNNGFGFQRF